MVRAAAWMNRRTRKSHDSFHFPSSSRSVSFDMARESEDVTHRYVMTSRRHGCRLLRQRPVRCSCRNFGIRIITVVHC